MLIPHTLKIRFCLRQCYQSRFCLWFFARFFRCRIGTGAGSFFRLCCWLWVAAVWAWVLTRQSTRTAYSRRLLWFVSPITRFMRAATYFSTRPCSKGFQAFLASSACAVSATSYHSCSTASLPWRSAFSWAAPVFKAGRPLLAFGSNCSSQPTAYGGG